jgi:hypothetical protein
VTDTPIPAAPNTSKPTSTPMKVAIISTIRIVGVILPGP